MTNIIDRLALLNSELKSKAQTIDRNNKDKKSLSKQPLFSIHLFSIKSQYLCDYVDYVDKQIIHLKNSLNSNYSPQITNEIIEKIEAQLVALHNAIAANQVIKKESQYQKTKRRQPSSKSYQKAVEKITLSSHQLYQQLSEHFEFERRLKAMIDERQTKFTSANKSNAELLQKEMLALHQRLGRCRKAITDIERQIEFAESNQNNSYKK